MQENPCTVSLSVVKNEADIIETMVRSNLRFIDFMVFVDNGSVDGTFEILKSLAEETGRISVDIDRRLGHVQQQIVNAGIRNIARDMNPRHVLLLDGDELLIADPGKFRDHMQAEENSLLLPWTTFVPTDSDDDQETNPVRRIKNRRRVEKPQFFKVTIPRAQLETAHVSAGSHSFSVDGKKFPSVKCDTIALGHWPVRSVDQILAKVLIGSWNMRLREQQKNEGYQWHEIVSKYIGTGRISSEDFFQMGMMYAARRPVALVPEDHLHNAIPQNRFDHLINRSPLFLVANFIEEMLAQK